MYQLNLAMQVSTVLLLLKIIVLQQFSLVLKQLLLAKNKSFYCFYDSLYRKAHLLTLKRI